MVKMINGLYGNEMWVAEDRVKEYLAAGNKLAADSPLSEKTVAEVKDDKKKPDSDPKKRKISTKK